jgi:ribonuclease J
VREVIQCRNGDLVQLSPQVRIIDEVPSGRIYKDGSLLVDAESRTVADRRRLSFAGTISVALAITDRGEMVEEPSVDLIGIPERDREGGSMYEAVRDVLTETFESLPRGRKRDPDAVAEALRRAVRAAVAQRWGKKPMCHVHVLTV